MYDAVVHLFLCMLTGTADIFFLLLLLALNFLVVARKLFAVGSFCTRCCSFFLCSFLCSFSRIFLSKCFFFPCFFFLSRFVSCVVIAFLLVWLVVVLLFRFCFVVVVTVLSLLVLLLLLLLLPFWLLSSVLSFRFILFLFRFVSFRLSLFFSWFPFFFKLLLFVFPCFRRQKGGPRGIRRGSV